MKYYGGAISFSLIQRISSDTRIHADARSKVSFGRRFIMHSGCKLKVRRDAELLIGGKVGLSYNRIIVCHERVDIGDGTIFGPSVYIYDHDHVYDKKIGSVERKVYKTVPIIIGKNCWIDADVVLLRGTVLGDNCIVGAGCVLKGKYPSGSRIAQERELIEF